MIINILRWSAVLALAFVAGKLITKIKMPSILGWLIAGMILGPHAIKLMPQSVLNANCIKQSSCGCNVLPMTIYAPHWHPRRKWFKLYKVLLQQPP